MSLVNDALKRATRAQEQPPASSAGSPPFHPVDPAQQIRRGTGLAWPILLTVVALLVLLLVWRWGPVPATTSLASIGDKPAIIAHARSWDSVSPATVPPSQSSPSPASASGDLTSPAAGEPTASPAEVHPAAAPAGVTTNSPAITEPTPPKPAPLKLQGIVFNPIRPSAVISGKTVFIGDRVREYRVVAIGQDTATLVSTLKTNVLSFAE